MPHSVLFFGSHPDRDNDDCWSGVDFETLAEARAFYAEPTIHPITARSTRYIVLDSPELPDLLVRKTDQPVELDDDHGVDEWRREAAREAGCLGGVGAYNGARGY